jgi:hypothetical protein
MAGAGGGPGWSHKDCVPARSVREQPLAKLGLGVPCADETMKPTSESLSPSGTWNRRVAECYCGAAMCRGELREAKDQPQTKVNSIRPGRLASRRRGGMRPRGWVPCEACGLGHTRSSDIARHLLTGGDVRVGGVRMVRRLHGPSLDRADAPRPSEGGTTPGNGTRSSTRSFPRRLWRWRLHR